VVKFELRSKSSEIPKYVFIYLNMATKVIYLVFFLGKLFIYSRNIE
jgi:hypothetical protein